MIPQRVKEIHGFLEQTLHLDAAHLILTREGYGKAGPAPWKLLGFTGDLVIERRYWKPVNPTIIMILVDLQFGGSIPTISGEIRSIDVYSLLLALPCSATLHVFCKLRTTKQLPWFSCLLAPPYLEASDLAWLTKLWISWIHVSNVCENGGFHAWYLLDLVA